MNQTDFQQTITTSGKPVIVDFWAPWCMPCKMTKPILEKLAQEYAGQVDFIAINADDSREVLEQYRVIGIPTVMAMRDGEVVARATGAQNEAGYRKMFDGLAQGTEVKVEMPTFDRLLRLGGGAALIVAGITTGTWLLSGLGAVVAFTGFYDRCPIWAAITSKMRQA